MEQEMECDKKPTYYRYWGKARTRLEVDYCTGKLDEAEICKKHNISQSELGRRVNRNGWKKLAAGETLAGYHLLPYHCLDVAAVAEIWWEATPSIQQSFVNTASLSPQQARAWVLFFIALHDYGKLDMRFQLKAPEVVKQVYPGFDRELTDLRGVDMRNYYHGPVGFSLFYHDFQSTLGWNEYSQELWERWQPWLAAVTGHHGAIPSAVDSLARLHDSQADLSITAHDREAGMEWVSALESLFLKTAGLSIAIPPPPCNPLLAGFCSVADWLGSNSSEGTFEYQSKAEPLDVYYQRSLTTAKKQLHASGLLSFKQPYRGISSLLPKQENVTPRQLQTLVDQLPVECGLTLIEAPTGSGKTETALAYVWRLLEKGLADSIIFALPTQATANAMLERLERCAPLIFGDQPNLVLAHGKAAFNEAFWQLKNSHQQHTEQGDEEARVQCAEWLSVSRKRAFLGQIGVCTIDQVLISVLPVRHKFVRGFGVGKSLLIVDEVHAYDNYMYGLLNEVLRQQRAAGGSALLLSATLPSHQREALSKTWSGTLSPQPPPYPLITHVNALGKVTPFDLPETEQPEKRTVELNVTAMPQLLPDATVIQQMIQAAQQGAQVVFICNLVDVAQDMAHRLREQGEVPVDLFHARYRFCDRQAIEKRVLDKYGKKGKRAKGAILVATQVVEQSLDLDFDWMITQLCPVDLLFQRLGRLHRHQRPRPDGYKTPKCTVLIPDNEEYGYHGLIYGNTRILWRTAQMLLKAKGEIIFPAAYRSWIELVYREDSWDDEPKSVQESYNKFLGKRMASRDMAKRMIHSEMSVVGDTDEHVSALTRDGEMSLNILPAIASENGFKLLDNGELIDSLDKWWRDEALNLNMLSVPNSWRKFLPDSRDGLVVVPMNVNEDGGVTKLGGIILKYSKEYGLEKEEMDG